MRYPAARVKGPSKKQHESAWLAIPARRPLRLVVVADTHSKPHPNALEHIATQKPDAILHAGDIGALCVLDSLREVARLFAVRGNIDEHAPGLPDSLDLTLTADDAPRLRVLLTHIAVYGPKLRADAARLARARSASLVVCGHSHVPFIGRDKGISIFNPGSVGPRRFSLPITFGVMQVTRSNVALRHVSAETGEDWAPVIAQA
jgi:putative phosphoesterase